MMSDCWSCLHCRDQTSTVPTVWHKLPTKSDASNWEQVMISALQFGCDAGRNPWGSGGLSCLWAPARHISADCLFGSHKTCKLGGLFFPFVTRCCAASSVFPSISTHAWCTMHHFHDYVLIGVGQFLHTVSLRSLLLFEHLLFTWWGNGHFLSYIYIKQKNCTFNISIYVVWNVKYDAPAFLFGNLLTCQKHFEKLFTQSQ